MYCNVWYYVCMELRIIRIGDSRGVIIPSKVLRRLEILLGEIVYVRIDKKAESDDVQRPAEALKKAGGAKVRT